MHEHPKLLVMFFVLQIQEEFRNLQLSKGMGFLQKLMRRKWIDMKNVGDTELARCLNTLDLTALGEYSLGYSLRGTIHIMTKPTAVVHVFIQYIGTP